MSRRQGLTPVEDARPVAMFTFVQVMGLCAMAIVTAAMMAVVTSIPNYVVMNSLGILDLPLWLLGLLALPAAGVGGCLLWLLVEFVCMCGRVRKETAFTATNVRALGRIVLSFVIVGALLLPLGKPLMDWLMLGLRGYRSPLLWLLPSFAAWTAALLVRAIQVLMRRAVDMQTEQDLTV